MNKIILSRLAKHTTIDKTTGCFIWNASDNGHGYGQITINHKNIKVHKLAYVTFVGNIPKGLCVLHSCDNRRCWNPKHLFPGTRFDNMQDCERKGRQPHAPERSRSVLTWDDVHYIREHWDGNASSISLIANKFGVNYHVIWRIVHNHSWTKDGILSTTIRDF